MKSVTLYNPIGFIILYLLAAWYWDFWPFTGGNLRPFKYEHDYNVFFYYPPNSSFSGGQEHYLGKVTGLTQCNSLAVGYARQVQITSTRWSYICCSIRKGSDCYEKER
jgi:hypothetical protein